MDIVQGLVMGIFLVYVPGFLLVAVVGLDMNLVPGLVHCISF